MKYPLASSTWDEKEISAIQRVIDSDMYSMGNEVSSFEEEYAEYIGSKYAVMTSSGSTANLLMIASMFYTSDESLRLERGDEIIVPAVSWSTTYFPLQQYGLKVKFVDICRETLNIDINQLKSAITEKTRAILAVNLLGNPNDFNHILELASSNNITLLEDNCESLGAKYNNKLTGTFGLMGTFSSFFSHHISTMEGGMVATDNEELYHILLTLRAHGWTRNLPYKNHVTGIKSKNEFEESFKFVLPGYNVRPLEMSGAIGREQLKKLDSFIRERRTNAEKFINHFKEHEFINIQKEIGESSWFGFSLVLKDGNLKSRDKLIKILKDNNIDCRPIVTGNFVKNKKVLKYFDYEIHNELINSNYIDQHGLFVGNHHVKIFEEIEYLHDVIKKF